MIPLIHFTGDKARMGEFANPAWLKWVAAAIVAVIVALNAKLVVGVLLG